MSAVLLAVWTKGLRGTDLDKGAEVEVGPRTSASIYSTQLLVYKTTIIYIKPHNHIFYLPTPESLSKLFLKD